MKSAKVVFTIIVLGMLAGCESSRPESKASGQGIWIYSDGSAPQRQYDFVIHGCTCFVQAANFPGYEDRKFYLCSALPKPLLTDVEHWNSVRGEVEPPFVPGGVHFHRTFLGVDSARKREVVFFKNENTEFKKLLGKLRAATVKEEFAVDELPEWVASNSSVKKELGFAVQ